jgi:para-nitrobenzyl esterase
MSRDSATVQTSAGTIEGLRSQQAFAFLGVPFAAPPFGMHRMRPPQPVTPWTGSRLATEYGPTAPKGDYPLVYRRYFREIVIPGDECLNLNIWTPDIGDVGLPVMVWIHGGSFANGSGSLPEYAGGAFARDGVVCVTINYRLGAEGFLYFDDGTANLGLRDQVAALEWVQENIAAFGGDPSRVTIAGESAGAMSVTCLLASPRAQGLFVRAIAQSGYAVDTLVPAQAQRVAAHVARTFGVADTRDAIREIPAADLALLSAELVDELELHPDIDKWGDLAAIGSPFSPTVDGEFLPSNPVEAFRQGQGAHVALLIGSNRDEGRLTMIGAGTLDETTDADLESTAADLGLASEGLKLYRERDPLASPGDILAALVTDWIFTLSPVRVSEAREPSAANTWVYRFDYPDVLDGARLGACHGAELPFVFDCVDLPEVRARIGESPRQEVADLVHGIWVNFISTGEPGWESYRTPDRRTALISETLRTASDPTREARLAWDGVR